MQMTEEEEREFYELMQIYRHAPLSDQKAVVAAFKEVQRFVARGGKPALTQLDRMMESFDISGVEYGLTAASRQSYNEGEATLRIKCDGQHSYGWRFKFNDGSLVDHSLTEG